MRANIEKIIKFWFGELENQLSTTQHQRIWYQSTAQDDALIRDQFSHLYEQAMQRNLENWLSSAQGTMALIILLDQMPRNMFRSTAQAFVSDHLALEYCLYGLEKGFDKQLALVERAFFYHPLEHAEDLNMQNKAVTLFQRMQQTYTNEAQQSFIRNSLHFAIEHRDIIERFSRFPHRNAALKRKSSEAEIAYLQASGVNFGQ